MLPTTTMAEVLHEFVDILEDANGVAYHVHACGAEGRDGRWQGWLEFLPLDGSPPVRSQRETTQPNRGAVEYWAAGLTRVYLDGALARALRPTRPETPPRDRPVFAAPAPERPGSPAPAGDAILDPFQSYEKGEAFLRRQLGALAAWHLVSIVQSYELADPPPGLLNRLSAPALVELIVSAVTARADRDARPPGR